jgi:hypothetical protein
MGSAKKKEMFFSRDERLEGTWFNFSALGRFTTFVRSEENVLIAGNNIRRRRKFIVIGRKGRRRFQVMRRRKQRIIMSIDGARRRSFVTFVHQACDGTCHHRKGRV